MSQALVQPHDVAATCLHAAGVAPDAVAALMPDSRDLTPVCSGEVDEVRSHAVCLYRNSGLHRTSTHYYHHPPINATMIRDGQYKLVVYHGHGGGQLFDMTSDPLELTNLWNDPAHQHARLELIQRMTDWLATQESRNLGSRGGGSKPPWWEI